MTNKVLFALISFLLFFSAASFAQKQLSDAELQNFYKLIKQTSEYKICKARVDSFNKAVGEKQVPQEINLEIVKKEQDAAADDYLFNAILERRMAIGFSVERYMFQYDKRKKQITSAKLMAKSRYQVQ